MAAVSALTKAAAEVAYSGAVSNNGTLTLTRINGAVTQVSVGTAGATGPAGPAGATGPAGPAGPSGSAGATAVSFSVTLSDENTVATVGNRNAFFLPFAFVLTEVRLAATIADPSVITTVNIKKSDGTSIFTTKLTIDVNEKTSKTAAIPPVIFTASFVDNEELTFVIDQVGTTTRGLKVWLLGTQGAVDTGSFSVPSAPTNLTVNTTGTSGASLSWTPPSSNGGSPVTDYVVEYQTGGGSWITFNDGISTTTNATITGLASGTNYNFRVSARNLAGTGPASSTATGGTTTSGSATAPGAPSAVGGVSGVGSVNLTWTAPSSNGGSAITDYVIQYSVANANSWVSFADGASTATSATVTGLTNETTYDFRVAAVNAVGTSAYALSGSPVTAGLPPSQVTGLAASPGNTTVALSWTAPASNGSAIIDYIIQYQLSGAGTWTTFADGTLSATTATVTGLTNASTYNFRVAAVNNIGVSSYSVAVSAIPASGTTVSGAPTNINGTSGSGSVTVTWSAPASNGGSAITDYVIQYAVAASGSWTTFADGTSTTTSATVTGLTNGTAYDFRVAATNGIGTSAYGTSAGPVIAGLAPAQVTGLTPVAGNTTVALSWTAPANNGSAITDYAVQYKLSSSGTWLTFADGTSTATSATVTGLTNGSAYDFRVGAVNIVGVGAYSASTSSNPTSGSTVPGAPTALNGTSGNGSVSLTWTAPSNGGSAITDYVIQYSVFGVNSWSTFTDGVSTAEFATVTGLTNGTTYDFRVAATNTIGTGGYSVSIATVQAGLAPSQVTGLSGSTGSAQAVNLSWTAPAANGSAITDYVIQYSLAGANSWTTFADGTSTATTATVTGLTGSTSYDFRVRATNAIGLGNNSATATVTSGAAASVPGQVTGLTPTVRNSFITLNWSAPASNGGSAITDYLIEYKAAASGTWLTFTDAVSTATTVNVTGLTNNTSYNFRVSAINAAGTGAASSTATATPVSPVSGTNNLSPSANSGGISTQGFSAYSNARVGDENMVVPASPVKVGQRWNTTDLAWECHMTYLEFDVSAFLGQTITSADLKLQVSADDTTTDFTIEAVSFNYGTSLDSSDWSTTPLAGVTLATLSTASLGTGLKTLASTSTNLSAAVASGGNLRVRIHSSRHRLNNNPGSTNTSLEDITITVASCVLTVVVP